MTRLILSPWQVRAALRGELKMVVLPVEPQKNYARINLVEGQRLWIAETWAEDKTATCKAGTVSQIFYKTGDEGKWIGPWRSPATMPHSASRMEFEVQSIGCKMLKDLTEEEAIACGVEFRGSYWMGGLHPVKGTHKCMITAKAALEGLWSDRYGSRYPWPESWVWGVGMEEVKQ